MLMMRYKDLTIYDLLETTWSNSSDVTLIGNYEGNIIRSHQFMVETEDHIHPLYVSEVNMNTRLIKYALPKTTPHINSRFNSNNQPTSVREFYESIRGCGVQISEYKNEILYNQEYFRYLKLKVLNARMDKVLFEAERLVNFN